MEPYSKLDFTIEKAIAIQTEQLNKWKKILKKSVYIDLVIFATKNNKTISNPYLITRGSDLSSFIANYKNNENKK